MCPTTPSGPGFKIFLLTFMLSSKFLTAGPLSSGGGYVEFDILTLISLTIDFCSITRSVIMLRGVPSRVTTSQSCHLQYQASARFHRGGLTITKRRNRLKGDIVEALQALKSGIKKDTFIREVAPLSASEVGGSDDEHCDEASDTDNFSLDDVFIDDDDEEAMYESE